VVAIKVNSRVRWNMRNRFDIKLRPTLREYL
jgi:hypothetical protein